MMTRFGSLRGGRRQGGAAVVEFAVVASLLILLMLAALDLSLLLWAHMTLQYAVREGARYAVVDQGNIGGSPGCADVIRVIQENSMGLAAIMNPTYEIQLNGSPRSYTLGSGGTCPAGMFGARGDMMVLKLHAKWPLFTPYLRDWLSGAEYRFTVAASMQNEER